MKWIIYIILVLSLAYFVEALPCEDNLNANVTCQMVTPSISCSSYNFTVFNNDSSINEFGNLSIFAGDVYYFNFSKPVGHYIIELCDGSTRQVEVGGGDTMFLLAVILLPLLFGALLMYWGSQLDEDSILRLAFQLFIIPLAWLSIHFGVIAVGTFYPQASELVTVLAQFAYYLGWLLFIIGAYLLYRLLRGLVDLLQQRKAKKEAEQYD